MPFYTVPQAIMPPLSGTATTTTVSVAQTSISLLPTNANRLGFMIANNGSKTIYVQLGATATQAGASFPLQANSIYIGETSPIYTGAISAISASGTNSVNVTELTP